MIILHGSIVSEPISTEDLIKQDKVQDIYCILIYCRQKKNKNSQYTLQKNTKRLPFLNVLGAYILQSDLRTIQKLNFNRFHPKRAYPYGIKPVDFFYLVLKDKPGKYTHLDYLRKAIFSHSSLFTVSVITLPIFIDIVNLTEFV